MHYFTIFCALFCAFFVLIPSVEPLYARPWPQTGAAAYWQQCPVNATGAGGGYATMGGKSSGKSMGARTPTDYKLMIKFANKKLAKYGSFVKPILKAVGKALRGRTLDFVRLIGTGTMNPKKSNGYKGSVYQIALALQIFNRFKHSGTKVLYQELVMGPGERNFWSKYGRALMGNETELTKIPRGATPKHGVTLLYVIGAPTELIEQLLQAYHSFLGKIMFITDDIKLMDETFLGYRAGSDFTRIRALRYTVTSPARLVERILELRCNGKGNETRIREMRESLSEPPTELIEQLLQAYHSFLGKIMFITDDIKLMDETFLGYRPGPTTMSCSSFASNSSKTMPNLSTTGVTVDFDLQGLIITFKDPASADLCLQQDEHTIDGIDCEVTRAEASIPKVSIPTLASILQSPRSYPCRPPPALIENTSMLSKTRISVQSICLSSTLPQKKSLSSYFGKFGSVEMVDFDAEGAIITFKNAASADLCLQQNQHSISGINCEVKRTKASSRVTTQATSTPSPPGPHSITVSGICLQSSFKESETKAYYSPYFAHFGIVTSVVRISDSEAIVVFKDFAAAENALRAGKIKFDGKDCKISRSAASTSTALGGKSQQKVAPILQNQSEASNRAAQNPGPPYQAQLPAPQSQSEAPQRAALNTHPRYNNNTNSYGYQIPSTLYLGPGPSIYY